MAKLSYIRLATYAVIAVTAWMSWRPQRGVMPVELTGATFPELIEHDWRFPIVPKLSETDAFPALYREAVRQVALLTTEEGIAPKELFVEIRTEEGGRILRFDLWHESAVGHNYDPQIRGDPSGKCRTVLYDPVEGKILDIHGWK